MRLSAIAAMASNRVIGKDNRLPWRIPEDLKRFKALTLGKPVIMGRKTFESLGRPLPGRLNIVLTRNPGFRPEGATAVTSLDAGLALCEQSRALEAFVIGGEEIYRLAMPRTDRIYLTQVEMEFDGDAWFPEWPAGEFEETGCEEHLSEAIPYRYLTFDRK